MQSHTPLEREPHKHEIKKKKSLDTLRTSKNIVSLEIFYILIKRFLTKGRKTYMKPGAWVASNTSPCELESLGRREPASWLAYMEVEREILP